MWVQCCVCQLVRNGSKWRRVEIPAEDRREVSHGYCPACARRAFQEARKLKELRQGQRAGA